MCVCVMVKVEGEILHTCLHTWVSEMNCVSIVGPVSKAQAIFQLNLPACPMAYASMAALVLSVAVLVLVLSVTVLVLVLSVTVLVLVLSVTVLVLVLSVAVLVLVLSVTVLVLVLSVTGLVLAIKTIKMWSIEPHSLKLTSDMISLCKCSPQ